MPATIDELERRLVTLEEERQRWEVRAVGDPRIPLLATGFDVEDAIFAPHSQYVVKESNQTITSDTTLTDDEYLLLPIGSHERWAFEFFIIWRAHVDGDIKFTITVPSGAAGEWVISTQIGTGSSDPTYKGNVAFGTSLTIFTDTTNQKRGAHIFGSLLNSSTKGNVTLQWAQNSSSGTGTIVFAYSWARMTRI